jgi:hypothetical protein
VPWQTRPSFLAGDRVPERKAARAGGRRLERADALKAELARQRERFVATAVEDLGFAVRDCERELDLTLERLSALREAKPLLMRRAPLCEDPADDVALMLPYDGSSWLNIAIISMCSTMPTWRERWTTWWTPSTATAAGRARLPSGSWSRPACTSDSFAAFVERTRALRVGNPTDRVTDVTPLASEAAARTA